MIPRYQRILFWSLAAGILLMAAFLLRGCQQAHKRLAALNDATPIAAPTTASTEDITLYLANDADASITPDHRITSLSPRPHRPRPRPPRAPPRHLRPPQLRPPPPKRPRRRRRLPPRPTHNPGNHRRSKPGQLAVINLRGTFIDNHPSGIQVEALTVQSIIGTLHAALPQITAIRFLVDGQPHDTLAGHADLLRTYPATDTTAKPTPPPNQPATRYIRNN